MTDFSLFEQAFTEYKNVKTGLDKVNTSEVNSSCSHDNTVTEKGTSVCIDCGEELQYRISHEKEWRYYGQTDEKVLTDPNRSAIRKGDDRTIFKDVENLGFSENIISRANKLYMQVTQGKIFRGNSRKAIVFACIFHAYKLCGKPQSHDRLIKVFNLSKKIGLRGLKHVNLHAPKDSDIRTSYITPRNLISEISQLFSATKEQEKEILDLYEKAKGKSSKLNRSRPLSIASSVVFCWIRMKGKEISLKDFAKKVILSEMTIQKLAKELEAVLNISLSL